jgi:ABC-type bacteriocin/lantibiotic exporter with double-glycine peptidase domain
LTSLEKIGQVMDLELEKDGGMAPQQSDQGIQLELMNISYKYPQEQRFIIDNLSLKIKPNNRVLITGRNDSGKSTLLYLVGGLLTPIDGSISIDGIPSKNYEYDQLRSQIGGYLRDETLFEGTLLENITLGMEGASLDNVKWAIENLNLARTIRQLGDGYHTRIYPQGKQFSKSTVAKILLARAIINKPRLLLLENSFSVFSTEDRLNILNFLLSREQQWTVLVSSSQPIDIPELIDQEIILKGGKIINK